MALLVVDVRAELVRDLDRAVETEQARRKAAGNPVEHVLTREEKRKALAIAARDGVDASNKYIASLGAGGTRPRGRPPGQPSRKLLVEKAVSEFLARHKEV